nr:MAG TPA: hypothetical protein [Caudoviricetes sp.]
MEEANCETFRPFSTIFPFSLLTFIALFPFYRISATSL